MELKKTLSMPITSFEMRANLTQKEPKLIEYWDSIDLYHKLLKKNEGNDSFSFHDGPPYANGNIHCGHMLNRLLKDFIVRYKSMSGFYTPFIFGFDTHGLPTENAVIKKGVDRKKCSPTEFREICRKYALTQVDHQLGQITRLGVLGDLKHPYITLNKDYEANQIEVFGKMALKGLIYKGLKPVYWSYSSESALAEAEIEYHDVKSYSIYVAFKVKDGKDIVPKDASFLIWTTTPWTLPANLAISANPRFEYGLFDTDKGKLVFLIELKDALISDLELTKCELIKTIKGNELEGMKAQHPFIDRDSVLILGDHVTSDTGTGLVHTAPGHGIDDYNVCAKYKIPPYCPVDSHGYMDETTGDELKGLFYEDANIKVIQILTRNNALLAQKEIVHAYPHDWRTKKPVIFRATPQWFCSIDILKDDLLKEIKNIKWIPSWGEGRMENMIKDRNDWCISRQRIWGVPLPIIYGEDGTPLIEEVIFKNIADIFRKEGSDVWFNKDASYFIPEGYSTPHSPNGTYTLEHDIMDVWFDSGSSFSAVMINGGYKYPTDLYLEGNDQYRGWFNASMSIGVAITGKSPFRTCLTHGWVLDEDSEKMSKSKGNGVDPSKVANMVGADILRLWAATIDYKQDVRLSDGIITQVSEQYRRIRNTIKFLLGNIYIDETRKFDKEIDYLESDEFIDIAILARLEEVKNYVISSFDEYDFASGLMKISSFLTSDLSSLYLDICKDTMYCEDKDSPRRRKMMSVIYECVSTIILLLSPILPFTMEEAYKALKDKPLESVMFEDYPKKSAIYSKDVLTSYETFLKIKEDANKVLEDLRKESIIGSSQEGHLILTAKEEKFFNENHVSAEEIKRLFIVSKVDFTGDKISAKRVEGEKCPRCWNYEDKLYEIDGEHVCHRCLEVLKKHV